MIYHSATVVFTSACHVQHHGTRTMELGLCLNWFDWAGLPEGTRVLFVWPGAQIDALKWSLQVITSANSEGVMWFKYQPWATDSGSTSNPGFLDAFDFTSVCCWHLCATNSQNHLWKLFDKPKWGHIFSFQAYKLHCVWHTRTFTAEIQSKKNAGLRCASTTHLSLCAVLTIFHKLRLRFRFVTNSRTIKKINKNVKSYKPF